MNALTLSFLSFYLVLPLAMAAETQASPVRCTGNVIFEGSFVDLTCSNGQCMGQFPAQDIHLEGKCDSNIDYEALGTTAPSFVSGTCKGGVISSTSFSQNVALYGDCTFEDNFYGSFYSSVYSPVGLASGYCQENGMSRIYFSGGTRPLTGQCRQN